jgi:hypothetical protein
MDSTTVSHILVTASQLGASAQTVLLWWLVIDLAKNLAIDATWLLCCWWGGRALVRAVLEFFARLDT